MFVRFKFYGLRDAFRKLAKLERNTAKQIWRMAVRAGCTIIIKAARPLVATQSKTLRKSLGVRIKARRRDGAIIGLVGPRRKFQREFNGRNRRASNYAHLVERGRKRHGRVTPRPFMSRAVRQTRAAVIAAMRNKINAEIERRCV